LFNVGGPERLSLALVVDRERRKPLRYEVEVLGPAGSPRVMRERLATVEPLTEREQALFTFLEFRGGKGVVRDPAERKPKRP
jgi:hypothetical protein